MDFYVQKEKKALKVVKEDYNGYFCPLICKKTILLLFIINKNNQFMKKNFTFLFALFLMFAGTMNVFADAYPFKITTDAENPELYAIKSGRSDAHWWTFDVTDNLISLGSYEPYNAAHYWYFMEVTEGGTTYLQLYPYLGEGKAMGYRNTDAGAAKVWAVAPGTEGYDCRWIFDNNNGNAPYGLKTSNGAIYLSHYGGGSNKMGMWTTGPAGDGGTAMYIEPVGKNSPTLSEAVKLVDIYSLQQRYGLVKDAAKYYCNVPQDNEGSLAGLLDNDHSSYFHSAWRGDLAQPEKHYLQAEVSQPVESIQFYFKKRHNNNNNRPVDMTILGSADGETYTEIANINSGFPTSYSEYDYMSEVITATEACKYFRFVINETNNNAKCGDYPFFTYSEFYIFSADKEEVNNSCEFRRMAQNLFAADRQGKVSDFVIASFGDFAASLKEGVSYADAKAEYEVALAMSTSDDLFTVVEDEATLAANKRYILVAKGEEGTVAMAAQYDGPTPYRLQTSVVEKQNVVMTKFAAEEGENLPYMIALESAGEGLWKLKDVANNAYLHWTSKRSLELDEVGSTWTISVKNGEAEIKLAGEERAIRYGDEDDRFACYVIGQNPVMLYEDAVANNFLVAYADLCALTETCSSMWMIPAVNEKFMAIAETVMAMEPVAFTLSNEELNGAIEEIEATIAFAWAMDTKYNEFKEQLYVCFDLQDNSTATEKVAAPFAEVVDKYVAYQWSVPATTTADFDDYIAEMKAAAAAYIMAATAADGFSFDSALLGVESEWVGTTLGKSTTAYLYNPAAKSFLGTANSWGTQVSFIEHGYKWTVSADSVYDAEWLFDNAADIYASVAGDFKLVPCQVGANKTAPTPFEEGAETGIEVTAEGIFLPKSTCLFMELNEEADVANYTLVFDVKLADVNSFTSLFQTNLENKDDGELFVSKGKLGINRGNPIFGYSGEIVADTWHKIVVVGNNGVISTYIDGLHIGTSVADNSWIINKAGVYLFLDEDGESTDVEVAGIQFWKKSLSAEAVAQLSVKDVTPTYIVKGPLCHPNGPENCHIGSNGYADQAPTDHVITRVGKSLYTIQQGDKYYAYKEGTTVLQKVDQLDENCYWQFVTAEERRGEYVTATAIAPANATFEIPGQSFGYNNTEVKEWTGEPSFGGEWANFVAYKENTENCEMSTVLSNMPNGVYRLKVQGFYRQGTSATEADRAAVAATRDNGTEIAPAKFFANDATVTVKNILDDAGKNTTSTHGVIYGQYGKAPHSANDASVYFNLGLYEHTLVFEVKEGDNNTIKLGLVKTEGVANDWIVMDNYRLEYLGAKTDGDYMGSGIVDALTEGDKYVYYTDANGKHHFLYAADEHKWVVVDEPTTIAFSTGKGTYAKSASHMTSNDYRMSNTKNGDGTGPIATSTNTRDWESQVFYKNLAGKYAIRLTNVNATNWGAYKFVNINAETLEVSAGEPELGDALYLWNISEEAPAVDDTAIEEVEVSEVANRAYYTLNGTLVDAPVKGITIVKTTYTNGKVDVQKIFVK